MSLFRWNPSSSERGLTVLLVVLSTLRGCASQECREVAARTFAVQHVIDGDTFVVVYDGESTARR